MTTAASGAKSAADLMRERCAANILLCYQCKNCTMGCPLSSEMDLKPNQMMRLLQLGRLEEVLRSEAIWLCASCQTCTTRCPNGIDIAQVIDTLKIIAQEQKIDPIMPSSTAFINAGLRSINWWGRMYELGLMLEMNLRRRKPFKDAFLGMKMFSAGRLKLTPKRAGYPRKLRRKEGSQPLANAVAYYPGCSLHASASEYDRSFRAVANTLGLELEEPKGWLCCGSTPAHWNSQELATALSLKNLALIESKGHKAVTVPCAMCFSRLKHAAYNINADPSVKDNVTKQLGYEYEGGVEIENAIDTFVKRVGLSVLAKQVKKPLSGLKVVCYYGCLLTRPPEVTGAEHPEYPMNLDHLMETCGADALDWSFKTDCCGGSLSIIDTDKCLNLVQRILDNAQAVGADAIVIACPMCNANLDWRQPALSWREGHEYRMPIFYFTQLMALALGLSEKDAALDGHMVDLKPLLSKKGLIP